MKVSTYVCMCVCIYVQWPAAGPTQPISPKFGVGSWFHPDSTRSQGATPNFDHRGYPSFWPCMSFLERQRIGQGPANKSCLSGWVCLVNFICGGLTPTPGPQGPLNKMRVFALIILRGPTNKSCFSGWVCLVKFYLWGAHLNPWPAGSTPPNEGICIENWEEASKQKLLLGVGLLGKILFVGGSPQLGARRVHPIKWGYLLLSNFSEIN
jgi:hypothetical protein